MFLLSDKMVTFFNHKFWFIFLISLMLNGVAEAKKPVGEPITYYVGYRNFQAFGVAWSGKDVYKDYSSHYPVVTYSDYTDNIDEFIELYPTVTVETIGEAYSAETFGDVRSGKFGSHTYLTSVFKNRDNFEKFLVSASGNTFWWTGSVQIGLGFKYEENKFYLTPFIDGWLYSGGAVWRYLHFGLEVSTITFNPKQPKPVGEPITYYVGYRNFQAFGVAWSGKDVYKDYSSHYPVVTYSDYADNIDEFIQLYPTVTIETYGQAYSDETFGDVGSGKFGSKTYLTRVFKNRDNLEIFLVSASGNTFWWTGSVQIGLGFKYEENKFYLTPFIDGWLYSGGAVWRYLHFGLQVSTITFNPKSSEKYQVILA